MRRCNKGGTHVTAVHSTYPADKATHQDTHESPEQEADGVAYQYSIDIENGGQCTLDSDFR